MIRATHEPWGLCIDESLGFGHERQVLTLAPPDAVPDSRWLVDASSGRHIPMQSAPDGRVHLLLAVAPWESLRLTPSAAPAVPDFAPVTVRSGEETVSEADGGGGTAVLANGCCALRVATGAWRAPTCAGVESFDVPGPILGLRVGTAGPWRGRTFFDTHSRVTAWAGQWLEQGPVRAVYRYLLQLAAGGSYEMRITLDAEQCFARVEEIGNTHESDQLVWDFSGDDLPCKMRLLDDSAGYAQRALHYHVDDQIGRLVCWTQFAQILGVDGAAIAFADSDDTVGFVTLDGGQWRGRRLNALEFWTRRWRGADPLTRRLLPPEAKADSMPSPERIAARGAPACVPHFSVEGLLGQSRRVFALTLAPLAELRPPEEHIVQPQTARISPFEATLDRARYRCQQGLLRRLHVQRGMMPLQRMADMTFECAHDSGPAPMPINPDPVRQREAALPPAELARRIDDFLQARVYGFWDGSGALAANCVVNRPIAFYMTRFGSLQAAGAIDGATAARWKSWFFFLAHLSAGEGYYPGPASMRGPDDPDSLEPLVAGMCNQNFYTDAITLCGTAAEVFPRHPAAVAWRRLFEEGWTRQLDYHRYPDSGLWEESHTYFQHVLATVLPLFLLRRARRGEDAFADPRFRSLLAGALRQVTPRDADYGGRRHLVAFGDHEADPETYAWVYGVAAEGVAPHDPALASQLAWLCREMGGNLGDGSPQARPPSDASKCGMEGEAALSRPDAPPWTDEAVQGLGYIFRSRDDEAGEILLALRAGAAWGHHHEDDGSIQLFAYGRCLIGDGARGHAQEGGTKHSAAGHSRWALRDYPVTNFRWRFNRGWIANSGQVPWVHAMAWCPAYMQLQPGNRPHLLPQPVPHGRAIVRLSPRRYLVLDLSDTTLCQTTRFHVRDGDVQIDGAAVHVRTSECRLSIVPLFPVGAPGIVCIAGSQDPQVVTKSLSWDAGTRRHSGFLIDMGGTGSTPPTCRIADAGAWIEAPSAPVEIAWTRAGITVRGPAPEPELILNAEARGMCHA